MATNDGSSPNNVASYPFQKIVFFSKQRFSMYWYTFIENTSTYRVDFFYKMHRNRYSIDRHEDFKEIELGTSGKMQM